MRLWLFALSIALAPLAAAQEADVLGAQRAEEASAQVGKSVSIAGSSTGGGACTTGSAQQTLHANNVMARLFNTGSLFWKGSSYGYGYEVPAYSDKQPIFTSSVWIGGMTGGELRLAGTVYGPPNSGRVHSMSRAGRPRTASPTTASTS